MNQVSCAVRVVIWLGVDWAASLGNGTQGFWTTIHGKRNISFAIRGIRVTKLGMVLISVLGCLIAGCASMVGPEANLFGDHRVTTASADQIFDRGFEDFNDAKLFALLDPESKINFQSLDDDQKLKQLSLAFLNANNDTNQTAKNRRNQILERLIAASNQRCNLYTTYLKRINTYTNGVFGTLTTVLGGAGAIVTGENTARLLAGLAGISSGTRAELNQAIFESVATSVIVPGISDRRAEFLKEIEKEKYREKAIAEYPIEWAVATAIAYHGLCSMDTGIAHAQKSMQSYQDLGIKKYLEIQEQIDKLVEQMKKTKAGRSSP